MGYAMRLTQNDTLSYTPPVRIATRLSPSLEKMKCFYFGPEGVIGLDFSCVSGVFSMKSALERSSTRYRKNRLSYPW